jgi:DMSO/TMAO reductase YedYZ molybdopterin-dependent catalytic subunit
MRSFARRGFRHDTPDSITSPDTKDASRDRRRHAGRSRSGPRALGRAAAMCGSSHNGDVARHAATLSCRLACSTLWRQVRRSRPRCAPRHRLVLLEPDRLITPNGLAYIRTECPPAAAAQQGPWTIKTSALIEADARGRGVAVRHGTLTLDELTRDARSMGPHLFECSVNNNPANFGLMSVAEWDGVPLTAVVSRLPSSSRATAVLVSGVDHDGQRSADSIPGASWIFPLASLDRLGAFVAVRMNGEPVPLDHGRPLRLVVPGWYGCAWIKWVNEVRLVGPDEPATSQMREFAGRTHQTRRHDLARDYAPAEIQTAATPVRVEKRRGPAGLEYRIVGIVRGGTKPVDRLRDSFRRSGCVETVVHLSRVPDTRGVGVMGIPLEARNHGTFSIALGSRIPQCPNAGSTVDTTCGR